MQISPLHSHIITSILDNFTTIPASKTNTTNKLVSIKNTILYLKINVLEMKKIRAHYLLIAAIALTFSSEASARIIKGKVSCEKKNLSGVIVTDGKNFTQTRKTGRFRMDISDSCKFVYIITPDGYSGDWSDGAPKFYQRADGKEYFSFKLVKTGDTSKGYNIIAVGDPQPNTEKQAEEFAGTPLDDICTTADELENPIVGLVLGDVCFDKMELMQNWKKSIVRTGFPFYAVPGNHDYIYELRYNDTLALSAYEDNFGPANYAVQVGSDLIIMLDNIIYSRENNPTKKKYYEGYTEEVLEWIKGLLEFIPIDTHIYIAQHSPVTGRISDDGYIYNGQTLINMLKDRKVCFISGHNHLNDNYQYSPNIIEHNVAAISGTWWDAYHCKDGTPRGYKVYTKTGNGLTWYYKSIGKDKNFQFEIFMPGECVINTDCIVINLWDYDEGWSVEWIEDDKSMGAMSQVYELNPMHTKEIESTFESRNMPTPGWKTTIKGEHYFAAKPSDQASQVTLIVKNRFGQTWKECIKLKK